MSEHGLAPTTHTTELRQIDEMNHALRARPGLTAAVLGVPAGVPPGAVLRTLRPTGSPSFPYVHGVFARPDGAGDLVIELHTAQLRAVSDRLTLRRHIWGV